MKFINLTDNQQAIVDDKDYPLVSLLSWRLSPNSRTYYARSSKGDLLHRFLTNPLPGFQIDHKNGNGLDCRRENLRIVTSQMNNFNRRSPYKNKTSIYKGVSLKRKIGKWVAQIKFCGKKKWLGYFENEIDAARRYDHEARSLFGSFAVLNFPEVVS